MGDVIEKCRLCFQPIKGGTIHWQCFDEKERFVYAINLDKGNNSCVHGWATTPDE
jgi:hypothetical protein